MEENYQIIDESMENPNGLELNHYSVVYLRETRKWAKFLAILLFIGAGLMVLVGIFGISMGSMMSNNAGMGMNPFFTGGPIFMVLFIAMSLLYLIPAYYLMQFSNYMKRALQSQDNRTLELAFKNLKSHYKFIGILAIIMIGVYLIGFLVAGIVGMSAAF